MTLRGLLDQLEYAVPAIIGIVVVAMTFEFGGLRINVSTSLPIGLYKTTSAITANLIEFCPAEPFASLSSSRNYRGKGYCPDGAEPLMKPIVAVAGDTVEFAQQGFFINGKRLPNSAAQRFDTKGRSLEHWPFGKYVVAANTVWVISSFNDLSFDSRYFGPISIAAVRCHLRPLLTE